MRSVAVAIFVTTLSGCAGTLPFEPQPQPTRTGWPSHGGGGPSVTWIGASVLAVGATSIAVGAADEHSSREGTRESAPAWIAVGAGLVAVGAVTIVTGVATSAK